MVSNENAQDKAPVLRPYRMHIQQILQRQGHMYHVYSSDRRKVYI